MSNLGKAYIKYPNDISIKINKSHALFQVIWIKGPLGVLKKKFSKKIDIKFNKGFIHINNGQFDKNLNAIWGSYKVLIKNMIKGVRSGFCIKLELRGLGYKATLQNSTLVLSLGYSHNIIYKVPKNLKVDLTKSKIITIWGLDLEEVTKAAFQIRSFKKPDVYKGKGICFLNEVVKTKEGKKQKI